MAGNTGQSDIEAFEHVIYWLRGERDYTLKKFGSDTDRKHVVLFDKITGDPSLDTWWDQQLDNYWHRIAILGLDTPGGRQALAKFVSTAAGMLTAVVQVYGELPKPGVPSGEIQ